MTDLDRLRVEYADRARRLAADNRYSSFNQANLFILQQRQRSITQALRTHQLLPLDGKIVLDLGCGSGGVLLEWLGLGVKAGDCHGVDLLPSRLLVARERLPGIGLLCADGCDLPYPEASFDLVLQFTVFSSILDPATRQAIAKEMLRVLRPNGAIVWYDFWLNPTNRQTQGMRPGEIRQLFPGCHRHLYRVTLAPPLARSLVAISWILALFLEKLRMFNSHYLAIIQPEP